MRELVEAYIRQSWPPFLAGAVIFGVLGFVIGRWL